MLSVAHSIFLHFPCKHFGMRQAALKQHMKRGGRILYNTKPEQQYYYRVE